MKYKVGDKVKVREDLIDCETYDEINYVSDMDEWKGKIVTISYANDNYYEIAEDNQTDKWMWSAEMFEDISDDENKARTVDVADNSKEFHDAFVKMIDFAKEHLTKEQFNEFVYTVCTCGIENVYITETPVYENIEHNGCVLWKRIKSIEYKVKCKNFKDDKIKDYEIRGIK